jgi:hypothetical protein
LEERQDIMPIGAAFVDTPYYLLLEENCRLGPEVTRLPTRTVRSAVYGFSVKASYDRFCERVQLSLRPYPLTKFFLRQESETPGDGLDLVVVDPAGLDDSCLYAVAMEDVLDAQKDRTPRMMVSHRFTFDQAVDAYRVTCFRVTRTAFEHKSDVMDDEAKSPSGVRK